MSRSVIQEHNKKGNLIGYFGVAKLGRPLKEKPSKITSASSHANQTKNPPENQQFSSIDWSASTNFFQLKDSAAACMAGDTNIDVTIPTRAINREVAKMKKMTEDGIISIEDITMEMMRPNERDKLLGENNLNFLQDVIVSRDNVNNGMCRAEVITLIGDLVQ